MGLSRLPYSVYLLIKDKTETGRISEKIYGAIDKPGNSVV